MNTHTPGPWKIEENLDQGNIDIRSDDIYRFYIAEVWGGMDAHKANAHLIAAAPDLLEALEALVKQAEGHKAVGVYWDEARAAIAKAKGETK
jgi:hypothetical protein